MTAAPVVQRLSGFAYTERAVAPLAPWVGAVWEAHGEEAPWTLRLVPHGGVELVSVAGAPPVVLTPRLAPRLLRLEPGTAVVGARLRPGALAGLIGVAAGVVADGTPVAALAPGRGTGALDAAGGSAAELADALAALEPGWAPCDRILPAAVAAVTASAPPTVAELGRATRGERELRRRFAEHVGLSPVGLGRVARLRRALDPAVRGLPWAARAVRTGFSDQAHLTRECRALTGLSPARLCAADDAPIGVL